MGRFLNLWYLIVFERVLPSIRHSPFALARTEDTPWFAVTELSQEILSDNREYQKVLRYFLGALFFQTARVGSRRAFFPRGNFGAHNSAAQSCYAPFLPQGKYAILKINVRQKSTGNFHACILTLYHIYHSKSIKIKTFVCSILSDYNFIKSPKSQFVCFCSFKIIASGKAIANGIRQNQSDDISNFMQVAYPATMPNIKNIAVNR